MPWNYDVTLAIQDEVIGGVTQTIDPMASGKSIFTWPIKGGRDVEPYFSRYAGICTLFIRLYFDDEEVKQWRIKVVVHPSKITQEQFDLLLLDIERVSRGLIYDLYAKSTIGLTRGTNVQFAAEEQLETIVQVVDQVSVLVRRLGVRPERRLAQRAYMVNARDNRPNNSFSMAWIAGNVDCLLPSVCAESFVVSGISVKVERFKTLKPEETHDIYEHQILVGFLARLSDDVNRISRLAKEERRILQEEVHWKDVSIGNQPSWWESHNKPRIAEAERRIAKVAMLNKRINDISNVGFLRGVFKRKEMPNMTPLFRDRHEYSRLFHIIKDFYAGAQITFDPNDIRLRMKDLATLYEYWCFLKIATTLSMHFKLMNENAFELDESRYVLSLLEDNPLVFRGKDSILNLYYQRRYEPRHNAKVPYGREGRGPAYLPDVACEIFFNSTSTVPDLVYIFDAKYKKTIRGGIPEKDIDDVNDKYLNRILRFDTYEPIVRHCWLVYPGDTDNVYLGYENFFSSTFKKGRASYGAIPMRPGEELDALDRVLKRILELDGII